MKRGIVFGVLLALGGLVAVQAQPPAADAPKVVDVEKVNDRLYVLRGANGGGNVAVFLTANGVVVVDAKNPGWGAPIRISAPSAVLRFMRDLQGKRPVE